MPKTVAVIKFSGGRMNDEQRKAFIAAMQDAHVAEQATTKESKNA